MHSFICNMIPYFSFAQSFVVVLIIRKIKYAHLSFHKPTTVNALTKPRLV